MANSNIMKIFITSCVFALALTACTKNTTEPASQETAAATLEEVTVSVEQMKTSGIEVGTLTGRSLSGTVKATGMLDVPPQNLVTISAPMGGFVKSTELLQGMKVTKGQVIAIMEHSDYIQLQQDYLDSKSQLEFLETEFHRQEDLAKENINAVKTLQQSKSNYLSMRAKMLGLKARLELVHISPASIENGNIQPTISLTSPITGFVTQVHVNVGKFVAPNDVMFKIVDTEHLHAEISIFEKDVPKIKVGQSVRIRLTDENEDRLATVYLVGKEIADDRTVRVHGHFKKEDPALIPGMYFTALIETNNTVVPSLPDDALVHFEGKTFAFREKAERNFEMIPVEVGVHEDGFTEVRVPAEWQSARFATRGAYTLLSMLKNTSEE